MKSKKQTSKMKQKRSRLIEKKTTSGYQWGQGVGRTRG